MNAKEQADYLYNAYYQKVADGSHPEGAAKSCAIIAVNQVIDNAKTLCGHKNSCIGRGNDEVLDSFFDDSIMFWKEVKLKLEQL